MDIDIRTSGANERNKNRVKATLSCRRHLRQEEIEMQNGNVCMCMYVYAGRRWKVRGDLQKNIEFSSNAEIYSHRLV